jgi:hypothetical protein
MEVRPAACAAGAEVTGPEFAVSVPAAAAAQCPTAAAKMKALVTGNALAAASKLDPAPRLIGPRAKIAAGAGAAVLAIAAFGIWRWRRRRRAPAA